jgi:hypothetical protein
LIKNGYLDKQIYTKNINFKELKSKKEEKVLGFPCKKFITNGKIYITKESSKRLKNLKDDKIAEHKTFKDYFETGVLYREAQRLKNGVVDSPSKKKKKMASTSKLKHIPNNNDIGSHLKTEYQKSDSEDYEIEYIEKLKKRGDLKVHVKPINLSVWVSEDFPIKISHFLPLLHILSFTSSEFAQLKSTLISNFPFDSLPLKISFPIGLSFYALLSVTKFKLGVEDADIFELNYQDSQQNINHALDNNYAQDFYERYYKEKNLEKDLSDSFSSIGRIRENELFIEEDDRIEKTEVGNILEDYINTDKTRYVLNNSVRSNGGNNDLHNNSIKYTVPDECTISNTIYLL